MFNTIYKTILILGFFVGTSVSALESEQRAKLQACIDASLDAIYSDSSESMTDQDKIAKVRKIVEANYDLEVMIRRAIGRKWQLMDASQQTRVLELVKEIVFKAYVDGLNGNGRPEVRLGDVIKISDKRMELESTIVHNGQTYHVLYRLGRMASGWQIYDIVAENVSFVSNYREQIDDHFRNGNADQLITRLEELLKKDTINENTHI